MENSLLVIASLIWCSLVPVFAVVSAVLAFFLIQSRRQLRDQAAALEASRRAHSQHLSNALEASFADWLREASGISFGSELEVEIKFIYPLVRFLRYGPDDIKTRVPVELQVGRQKASGIADWVIYRESRPYLVIEAKDASQAIGPEQRGQARSYAYGLGAPYYMLTNGKVIEVYERGVDSDQQVVALNGLIDPEPLARFVKQ